MAAKLNILVCDMEAAMQESAKHVSDVSILEFSDHHGGLRKSQRRTHHSQRD